MNLLFTSLARMLARVENRLLMVKNKVLLLGLGLLGIMVLGGDIYGDIEFFSEPSTRRPELVITALLRNLLTLFAVGALFVKRKVAAYLLILVALLGAFRRGLFLGPVFAAGQASDLLLLVSGFDVPFRMLIFGLGLGFLAGRESSE